MKSPRLRITGTRLGYRIVKISAAVHRGGIGVCERCGVLRSCKPLSKFVTPITLLPRCRFTAAALTLPKFLVAERAA
jgi:hypothetical protein